MRVLELQGDGFELELHPFVTVVQGLTPNDRERVVAAFAALPSGAVPPMGGVLEAHGVLLDLDASTVQLLDVAGPLDVIVRSEDLPGGARSPAERARHAAEEALAAAEHTAADARAELERVAAGRARVEEALEAARRASPEHGPDAEEHPGIAQLRADIGRLAEEATQLEQELEEARQAHSRAAQALALAQADVDLARHDRRTAAEACTLAAVSLEAARTGRDPFAAAAVETARERLVDLQREIDAEEAAERARAAQRDAQRGARPDQDVDLRLRIEQLEARRPELEAALFALDAVDPYPVRAALDALRDEAPTQLVPSPEAIALADEWADLQATIGPVERAFEGDAGGLASARSRLDAARAELFEAEQAVRLPELDRGDVDELETAHAAVLDAQEKSEGRVGRARALKRLEAAREAEGVVLDRLGFTTYAEFMMGTSILRVDPETEQRLDDARAELSAAEDAWHELQVGVDEELATAALLDRRRALRERARVLLRRDPGDDVEWALREHRIAVTAATDRAARLRAALEGAGLALGDEELSEGELVELATVWLGEERDTGERLGLLQAELAELDAAVAEAVEELRDRGELDPEEQALTDPEARRAARLHEAQAAVAAAEARRARHLHAEAEIAECQAKLEGATAAEQAAAHGIADANAALDAALADEQETAGRVSSLEVALGHLATAEFDAVENLRSVEEGLADGAGSLEAEVSELSRRLAEEHEVERAAQEALADAEDTLAATYTRMTQAHREAAAAADAAGPPGDGWVSAADIEEVEWYLLARLAAQRSVSFAGSLPLVLDDALAPLTDENVGRVLERLERMAASVQVVVLSDDAPVLDWAGAVGPDRAAVVQPRSVGVAAAAPAVLASED